MANATNPPAGLDLSDPETRAALEQILGLGAIDDQQSMMQMQLKRADALRQTPSAQGREVGQHNVYVASSPLEHLGVALQRGMGERDVGNIMGQRPIDPTTGQPSTMYGTLDQQKAGRMKYLTDILRGGGFQQQPQPPAPPELPGLDPRFT